MTAGKVFLGFLFFLVSFALLSSTCSQFESLQVKTLDHNEFITQLNSGNIESVKIEGNGVVSGNFRQSVEDRQKFKSYILPGVADLVTKEILEAKTPPKIFEFMPISNSLFDWIMNYAPLLLILFSLIFFMSFMRQMGGAGNKALSFGKSRAKLFQNKEKITFNDVAGQEEAKEELQEIVIFLKEPQKFSRLGGKIPRGVILIGPPGTGKTLMARAVAGEANVPFFSISGSDFVEMFVGVDASRVRDLFEQGKSKAPCIVFIDELDAVGRHRGTGLGSGHDEREQTLNQLLVEMDGFETNEGVIVMAATNRPDVLDPALLRPGRFDRRIVLGLPDIKGREGILTVHTKKIPLDDKISLAEIARGTPGFSGADLANLVNEAALNAARYNRKTVAQNDFESAKDKIIMGSERKLVISEEEKKIIAFHEAGHAVMMLLLPKTDPMHKVTIVPRGLALGVTVQLPEEDKHNFSRAYLIDKIAILMGGRCAEEIFIGEITTGASNDIEQATELARRMVREWGMSESIGPINYAPSPEHPFLGKTLAEPARNYSEQTAKEIDEEVKKIIQRQHEKTLNMLRTNKSKVAKIAQELLEREILTGDEARELIKGL